MKKLLLSILIFIIGLIIASLLMKVSGLLGMLFISFIVVPSIIAVWKKG